LRQHSGRDVQNSTHAKIVVRNQHFSRWHFTGKLACALTTGTTTTAISFTASIENVTFCK